MIENQQTSPARLRRWGGSLKLRLALASGAIIALSVIVVSSLVLERGGRQTEKALLDSEAANAERLASVLRQRVVRLQVALRAAAAPVDAALMRDTAAQVRYMQQRQVLATLFSNIALVSADGRILVLRDGAGIHQVGVSVADRPYFQRTLLSGQPVISEPLVGRMSHDPIIVMTMPISVAGQPGGAVLTGSLRLSSRDLLADLAATGSEKHEVMQTLIADATGLILAHPDPAMVMKPIESVPGLRSAVKRWMQAGRPIEPLPDAVNDAGYVVAKAGVAGVDWMVYRSAPSQTLLGGFQVAVRQAMIYGASVALVATCVLWWWLVRLMRPLDRLEERARALGPEGLPLEEGWPDAPGEVGELERALRSSLRSQARIEASNASLLDKLRSVMSTAPMGLAFTRARYFEVVSDEWCRLLGYPVGTLVGEPARLIYASEAEYEQLGPRVAEAFAAGQPFVGDIEFLRRDGSRFIGEMHGRPVNVVDAVAGTIWLLRDVTDEREAHRELAWTANHDALTGLVNRRHFNHELSRLLAHMQPGMTAAVLFIDLDRFKQVNDSAGHAAGDQVLREVAHALVASVRRDELVARLGGDEFAIVLSACDLASAERIAHKVRLAIEQVVVRWGEYMLSVGASVGVVEIPASGADMSVILNAADLACYEAKQAGRNAVRTGTLPTLRLITNRPG
jgi:diguanylate cyclase